MQALSKINAQIAKASTLDDKLRNMLSRWIRWGRFWKTQNPRDPITLHGHMDDVAAGVLWLNHGRFNQEGDGSCPKPGRSSDLLKSLARGMWRCLPPIWRSSFRSWRSMVANCNMPALRREVGCHGILAHGMSKSNTNMRIV